MGESDEEFIDYEMLELSIRAMIQEWRGELHHLTGFETNSIYGQVIYSTSSYAMGTGVTREIMVGPTTTI
jgi:hypothetical protein